MNDTARDPFAFDGWELNTQPPEGVAVLVSDALAHARDLAAAENLAETLVRLDRHLGEHTAVCDTCRRPVTTAWSTTPSTTLEDSDPLADLPPAFGARPDHDVHVIIATRLDLRVIIAARLCPTCSQGWT